MELRPHPILSADSEYSLSEYFLRKMKILLIFYFVLNLSFVPRIASAETIQIIFNSDDSYSIDVAHINVGDTVEWLPNNEGHNVEFLVVPNMELIPKKSELNEYYTVTFHLPGVYLYHCTPHGNMGMLGLIVVGNDFHNLEAIEEIEISRVARSVLQRLIRIAQSKW